MYLLSKLSRWAFCLTTLLSLPSLLVAETETQHDKEPSQPLAYASSHIAGGNVWTGKSNDNGSTNTLDDYCACEERCFFGYVDYLYLTRHEEGGGGRDLIYADNNASQDVPVQPITRPQTVAMNTSSFDHDHESAVRGTLGFHCCNGTVEASFLYLDEHISHSALAAGDYSLGTQLQHNNHNPNAVNIDTTVASVQNLLSIAVVDATRHSQLRDLELNYRTDWLYCDCMYAGALVGVRGLLIEEDLTMNLSTSGGAATYRSDAKNLVVGGQVGGYLGYRNCFCECFDMDAKIMAKGGVGLNMASLDIDLENADAVANPSGPDESSTVGTTFAELSVSIGVSFKCFELRAGYYTLLVNAVELGGVPSQLFIGGSDPVSACDKVFYHGFVVGAGFSF